MNTVKVTNWERCGCQDGGWWIKPEVVGETELVWEACEYCKGKAMREFERESLIPADMVEYIENTQNLIVHKLIEVDSLLLQEIQELTKEWAESINLDEKFEINYNKTVLVTNEYWHIVRLLGCSLVPYNMWSGSGYNVVNVEDIKAWLHYPKP